MGVEVIHHQHQCLSRGIVHIDQFADEMSPILAGPPLGDFHLPLSREWLAGQKQLAHPRGFKCVIKPFRPTFLHGKPLSFVLEQVFGTFIHADLWKARIVGPCRHL